MRRTTTLTAAAALGLGLLAPTTTSTVAATAAAVTCQGLPATIIGTPGTHIVGTEGPDVIVSDGAMSVDALGGDDVICLNGETGFPPTTPAPVDAGPGDDTIDSTNSANAILATLGTGADTFVGSSQDDRVSVAYPDPASSTPDVFSGGGGSDGLSILTGPGAAVIDNVAGRLTSDGQPRATWSGLEEFWLEYSREQRPLTFVGSDADELVVDRTDAPAFADIHLGKGDDTYRTGVSPVPGSRIRGGDGRDLLAVTAPGDELELDLKRRRMIVETTPFYVSTPEFEDAELVARRLLLRGGEGSNRLGFTACRAVVKGRGGADTIRRTYDSVFEPDLDCTESARIAGGPGKDVVTGTRGADVVLGNDGHDTLRGGNGNDRVYGGRGRDRADGGKGRDRCGAEVERRCER
ncbi:Ca2+-binding RTX toxin-like protein [Nocardioides cavernae]|uniref:Ca2+-binding RTX toxin-like protein n=1 Tax=Nocardioides cavernae TaxID=1921566 RepID=A0A7Y9H2F6_9ACTN|nr:calcium-binding protein [Nocardioides cavernae]NYE36710.1 Ca2+-binding RTX toxin-like protein [Nocardioides cavernae]